MKKKILAMLILCSTVSLFAGCGLMESKDKGKDKEVVSEKVESEEQTQEDEEKEKDKGEEKQDDEKADEDKKTSSSKGDGSSIEKPLKIDEEGKIEVKVYNGEDEEKKEFITMNIDNIYRGKDAKKYVDEFNSNDKSSLRIEEAEENCEYLVVEYSVVGPKLEEKEVIYADLDLDIKGVDGETLTVDNTRYYLSSVGMQEETRLKSEGSLNKMYLISQMPKNAKEFLMFFNKINGEGSYYLYKE